MNLLCPSFLGLRATIAHTAEYVDLMYLVFEFVML